MNKSIGFRHYRVMEVLPRVGGEERVISGRGGATMAFVDVPKENGKLAFGAAIAYCNPSDNFQYVYGRNKSRGRLVQAASNNFTEVDDDKTFYIEVEDRDEFLAKMDAFMEDFGLSHL